VGSGRKKPDWCLDMSVTDSRFSNPPMPAVLAMVNPMDANDGLAQAANDFLKALGHEGRN